MKLTQLILSFFGVILFSTAACAGPPSITDPDVTGSRGHLGLPWEVVVTQLGPATLEGGCILVIDGISTLGEGRVWESLLLEKGMQVRREMCGLAGIIVSENVTAVFFNISSGEEILKRTMSLIDYQLIKLFGGRDKHLQDL